VLSTGLSTTNSNVTVLSTSTSTGLSTLSTGLVIAHGAGTARPDQATAKAPPMRSRMASSAG
jgi:hypothetical protein